VPNGKRLGKGPIANPAIKARTSIAAPKGLQYKLLPPLRSGKFRRRLMENEELSSSSIRGFRYGWHSNQFNTDSMTLYNDLKYGDISGN